MTAEIAVMNKTAVALAADSAVTVGNASGPKIYNTVNKLFALSRYEPVGLMIYGNAQLNGVPWETIIKEYRKKCDRKAFPRLADYSLDFFSYLRGIAPKVFAQGERMVFRKMIERAMRVLKDRVLTRVLRESKPDVVAITLNTVESLLAHVMRLEPLPDLPANYGEVDPVL